MADSLALLREETVRCLTLEEEALDKLLQLLKDKLKPIKNGNDIVKISKEVAEAFAKKYPSPSEIFEGKPHDCKRFFAIFTEKQLLKLREFSKTLNLEVQTSTFKDALFDYTSQMFEIFKEKTTVEGKAPTEEQKRRIEEIWNSWLNGYFKNLIYGNTEYKAHIATVRVKSTGERINPSDPFFLTYKIVFSPYGESGIVQTLEEGKFEESVKNHLKKKILEKLKEEREEDDFLDFLGDNHLKDKIEEGEERIDQIVEGLFEAIDTLLRARIELEHFEELLKESEPFLENGEKEALKKVLENLELLKELLEADYTLWGEVVGVLPVGFSLEDKITDYQTQRDFWHFLYTYRVKVNEISEGAVVNFLGSAKGVKTRSDYFIKLLKKAQNLDWQSLSEDDISKLPIYAKALPKALFFYGEADKELARKLQRLVEDVRENLKSNTDLGEGVREVLDRLKSLAKEVSKRVKSYKIYNQLYEEIANKFVSDFVKKLPDKSLNFLVAVDFDSLADIGVQAVNRREIEPKTKRYRGLLKLLKPGEEKGKYEYILKVETFAKNFYIDLKREIEPHIETLKPLKDLEGFVNLTAELSNFDFGGYRNKQTYRLAFALSYLILALAVSSKAEGALIGFSLPFHQYVRDFAYALGLSLHFALLNDKVSVIQNFNWNNVNQINIKNFKSVERSINWHINQNKKLNLKAKFENGFNSAYSNLPFEVEGFNLDRKVAILVLSHPERRDKALRALLGEVYLFEPLKVKSGVKVKRTTLFGVFPDSEDQKAFLNDYKETLKGFLENLSARGVEKVYTIPPLPVYRGLSTKEVLFKKLYFSGLWEELAEIVPIRLLFSSFAVVFTPKLTEFKNRIREFLKKEGVYGGEGYVSVNLFEGLENIVHGGELIPLVVPKLAVIPLFSMEEGKVEKKTLNHHAFIYSSPSPKLFEGLSVEKILLREEERREFVNLAGVIHLIQYQKSEGDFEKTFKRNPFHITPIRRSGDKNVFAETEFDVYFHREAKPKFQTLLGAFVLKESLGKES